VDEDAPTVPPGPRGASGPLSSAETRVYWRSLDGRGEDGGPDARRSLDPDLQETEIIGEEDGEREARDLSGPVRTAVTTAVHTPAPPTGTGNEWGRYEVGECLGEGGMGVVYRAEDPTLDRSVALKFIRQGSPDLVQRFFREARAQARVQHPNVCNVYEAGELNGEPYIAMQFIDGVDLAEATADLGIEPLLRLIEDVSLAVHAAHRLGLIHRDLKPGNILVETTPDGELKPYVMDFGLVRDERDPGTTVSGAMLGTPAYMAPEQAMGETDRIDRRTDVYSLGSMMYRLLLGRPVFQKSNAVAQAMTVVSEEPTLPRRIDPSIPRDVETIVLKCLEKKPQDRYDSARALARDIRRYLDGDPIEARPIGLLRRLVKRARKHRVPVAVVGAALAAVLVLAGIAIHTRHQADRQALLAQQFGSDASDIEWIMRVAHMADFHDIRSERETVRRRMADIEDRMGDVGALGRAPGHYALGRGHLALGDYEAARGHLELAWADGLQDADVAYALGLTMVHLYQRELAAARSIADRDLRELGEREARAAYRDPTIRYLSQGRGSQLAAPEYVEGLLALVEDRHGEALEKARFVVREDPGQYEARILEGDVHRAIGHARASAYDIEGALGAYDEAIAAYGAAVSEGESDPAAYEGTCETWINVVTTQFWMAMDVGDALSAADIACARALTIEPDRASALIVHSMVEVYAGSERMRRGEPPAEHLARAAFLARRAIRIDPDNARAYDRLGLAYSAAMENAAVEGRDVRTWYEQAIRALERAVALDPTYAHSLDHGGRAHRQYGWWEWEQGRDPVGPWEAAILAFERAGAIREESVFVSDLGNVYLDLGQYREERGLDGLADAGRAVDAFETALRLGREDPHAGPYAQVSLGTALAVRAKLEKDRGLDPTGSLAAARQPLERAAVEVKGWHQPHKSLGWCDVIRAEHDALIGEDPLPALTAARTHLQEALTIEGSDAQVHTWLGGTYVAEAEHRMAAGARPDVPLSLARAALDRARALQPDLPELAEVAADVEICTARWEHAQGRSAAPHLETAEIMLATAVERAETYAAIRRMAECELLRAMGAEPGSPVQSAHLHAARTRANRALELRSEDEDALGVLGRVHLLRAESGRDPAVRRTEALAAQDAFARALAANPLHAGRIEGPRRRTEALLSR